MLKPSSCSPCPLYNTSDGWILPEGLGSNGVVILGEAGGYHEYVDNLPFRPQAQSGSKLEEVFKDVSRDTGSPCTRSQFLLYNVVNCHPPRDLLAGMGYEQEAIKCCSSNVDRVISGFNTNKVKTILALGNIPLKALTGVSGIADEKQSISYLRGYVLESIYGPVVASYHPSFIRRGNSNLTPILVEDMKKALNVARGVYTNYPSHKGYVPPRYQTSPGLDEAWSFFNRCRDNEKLVMAVDIETNQTGAIDEDERDNLEQTDITMVQFSLEVNKGIALPFSGDYIPIVEALLRLPNTKAGHNWWNFDSPRLRAKGFEINGKIHDTMWMFKHWHPKLPRGLQSVVSLFGFSFPWKHLYGANFQWYGCADVDAVQWILRALPRLMKERGVWSGYYDHVFGLNPINTRATERGIPASVDKIVALEIDFRERRRALNDKIQKEIPDELRNVKPKRKDDNGEWDYGYIREPKIVGDEVDNYERLCKRVSELSRNPISFEEFMRRKHNLSYAQFEGLAEDTGERTSVERWCVIEEFKASSNQLIKYLNWRREGIGRRIEGLREDRKLLTRGEQHRLTAEIRELEKLAKDYEVPINLKTKRETTSHKELEEMFLRTGDSVLEMVCQIRSYDTNLNNYIPNWLPSKDERVHPVYGYTAPQGQINSWRPNSQNVSKHTVFGNEFRGIIEAPLGYCFVELDKKSFHVGTMGYCANDRDYIRFSQIDPHSILGSYIDPSIIGGSISLKWSDEQIKDAAKEFKKRCKAFKALDPEHNVNVRQALAKPTVLGNQLGLGAQTLQRQNRKFIPTIMEAERLQKTLCDLFPKVEVYKKQIQEKAFVDRFLINEYGRIQYFYDVFQFHWSDKTRKWERKDGEGARLPIAFRVQGTAFGMITDELLECDRQGLCEEHNYLTTIHDSLMFMPEIGKKDKCIEDASRIMNSPTRKLCNEATGPEGLKIGVEVAVGRNWKAWDKVSNSEGMREM